MKLSMALIANSKVGRAASRCSYRIGRPRRVTKEMTSAARKAVRKANESARQARFRAIRDRHRS